jgi:cytidine deaminase
MDYAALLNAAVKAREASYCPYSHFSVGAALLCYDGSVYLGSNIENAAFTPTVCAERVAFYKAISEGKMRFKAIAVSGGKEGGAPGAFIAPCGVCRQVMMEFCVPGSLRLSSARDETESLQSTISAPGLRPEHLRRDTV